uniref:Uncharacterized protein n=1 Tax=Anguilla anguilla TaxID=7936 RepID=A0A0E9WCR5_ANGAN
MGVRHSERELCVLRHVAQGGIYRRRCNAAVLNPSLSLLC